MLSIDPAEARDIGSLQNWLNGTGCVARDETAYLAHSKELASLAPFRDSALARLEVWVEYALIRFYRGFRKVSTSTLCQHGLTPKPRIVITIFPSIPMCICILVD
jgi:hypothetical protein